MPLLRSLLIRLNLLFFRILGLLLSLFNYIFKLLGNQFPATTFIEIEKEHKEFLNRSMTGITLVKFYFGAWFNFYSELFKLETYQEPVFLIIDLFCIGQNCHHWV